MKSGKDAQGERREAIEAWLLLTPALILLGVFKSSYIYSALGATGLILGAVYMLWAYQRVMFGPLDKPENKVLRDVSIREIMVLLPLVVMFLVMGIYPKPFLSRMEPTVSGLIKSKFEERITVRDNPAELLNKNLAYPGKTRLLDK